METLEEILTKDIDDVVDWIYGLKAADIPKAAEEALQVAMDSNREVAAREKAISVLRCAVPTKGAKTEMTVEFFEKAAASLRQLGDALKEPGPLRIDARITSTFYLQAAQEKKKGA